MGNVEAQIQRTVEVHQALLQDDTADKLRQMAGTVSKALAEDHAFYVVGNGGSAAQAQHVAAELVGRFMKERRALRCVALTTDTSVLSAIANDYGYNDVFRRQVEGLVRSGDVLLALSTSGNSENVLKAMGAAGEIGAHVLAMTGRDGGEMAKAADCAIVVREQLSARIQEAHLTLLHILCDLVEDTLFGGGDA